METLKENKIKKVFKYLSDECFVAYLLVAIFIIAIIVSDDFLSATNITNLLRQCSLYGIIAIGTCTLLLSGNIDLSLGSQVGFAGVILAKMVVEAGINTYVAVVLTLIAAVLVGGLNGMMVIRFRIPAMVITVAMQQAIRGVTYLLTDAYPISGLPENMAFFGRGYIGIIPFPVIVMFVLYVAAYILTMHTRTGRYFYTIGGNREAAYLAGINVKKNELLMFLMAGFLAGVVGVILTSRMMSGQPQGGLNFEFDALTAALIAGVKLDGGRGKVANVLLGAVFVGILNNIFNLVGMSLYWQQVTRAMALLFSVLFDKIKTGEKSKI